MTDHQFPEVIYAKWPNGFYWRCRRHHSRPCRSAAEYIVYQMSYYESIKPSLPPEKLMSIEDWQAWGLEVFKQAYPEVEAEVAG